MNKTTRDDALQLPSPRLLTAAYYGVLAAIASVFLSLILSLLQFPQLLPIFLVMFLALIVGGIVGALFGKLIIHSARPFKAKVFCYGFVLVIIALAVYDLFFLGLFYYFHGKNIINFTWDSFAQLYLSLFYQSVWLGGFWFAVLGGFAALYLRGCLAYVIMQSDAQNQCPEE